jgi:NADPH2:quinone reductase
MQRIMRAIQISTTGPSSVLEVVTKAIPAIGTNDLLVKNAYAGVNYIDTYHRSGIYPLRSNIIGMEGAGEVVSVGDNVASIKVGDLVAWPSTTQSYAEYVAVPHDRAVVVPSGVDLQTACAAMLQGLTAHYLVAGSYNIKPGDWALVHAASGGVGLILTQMIKARGGNVIGTCSTEEKAALAREAGADHVIVGYEGFPAKTKELTGGKGVDVVYDGVGKDTFIGSLDSLRVRGMCVLFGGASGQVPPFDLQGLSSRGSLTITRPTLGHFIATAEELQWRAKEVFDDVLAGKLSLRIGAVYPVEQVRESHDDLEGRKTTGKLLLKF